MLSNLCRAGKSGGSWGPDPVLEQSARDGCPGSFTCHWGPLLEAVCDSPARGGACLLYIPLQLTADLMLHGERVGRCSTIPFAVCEGRMVLCSPCLQPINMLCSAVSAPTPAGEWRLLVRGLTHSLLVQVTIVTRRAEDELLASDGRWDVLSNQVWAPAVCVTRRSQLVIPRHCWQWSLHFQAGWRTQGRWRCREHSTLPGSPPPARAPACPC